MPVAVVQDWVEPVSKHSAESYDRISELLGAKDDPPRGLLMHTAGHTGEAFRLFEVWETQADFDVFIVERLMPVLRGRAAPSRRRRRSRSTSCATTSSPDALRQRRSPAYGPREGQRATR